MGMAAADQDEVGNLWEASVLHGRPLAEPARFSKGEGEGGVARRWSLGQTAAMSQSPRITVTQSQRLQLNLGLHAAIRLLRADAAGLTRYLEEAAAENPALQLNPPPLPAPAEWLPRWSRAFGAAGAEGGGGEQTAAGPSLMAHVLAAIDRMITPARDRDIARALAEALEPTGWLGQPVAAIAARLHVKPREVVAVVRRLLGIDPPGLFASDLADCL